MYSKVFYNQKTELSNYVDIIEMADETTYSQIKDLISTTTGISSIRKASTLTKEAPRYNLSGQRVSDSYKGIVIQNGHKYVVK
jgi:hypothetical protein